jgi:hypothetical protein
MGGRPELTLFTLSLLVSACVYDDVLDACAVHSSRNRLVGPA